MTRLAQIDGLRGIAAMYVALFHFTDRYDQLFEHSRPMAWSVRHGLAGVELFFVISGFVIFMTLERCRTPLDFIVSRASRLLPAYWAAVALVALYLHATAAPGSEPGWLQILVNLTMIQELLGVPSLDGVYWSLQAELLFYLMMLCLWIVGGTRHPATLVVVWIGLSLAEQLARLSGLRGAPYAVQTVFNLTWCPWFALGIIAYLSRGTGRLGPALTTALSLAIVDVLLRQGPLDCLVAAASFVLVRQASRGRLGLLETRPLLFLGAVSYPLYLVNEKVSWLTIGAVEAAGYGPNAAVAAASVAALAVAWLLHRRLEVPAMQWIRARHRGTPQPDRFRRKAWAAACAAVLVAAVAVGPVLRLAKAGTGPIDKLQGINGWPHGVVASTERCADLAARQHPLVLVLGQSNAASHGEPGVPSRPPWIFVDGRCARSGDPLPGTTGRGASLWPLVAERLATIRPADAPAAVFAPLAVGDTKIDEWTLPGPLRDRLLATLTEARRSGLPIVAIAWQQGEADALSGTDPGHYQEGLRRLLGLIRQQGVDAPVLVARSTRCFGEDGSRIAAAVTDLLASRSADGLLAGPDTDTLKAEARYDRCHFSRQGLAQAADMWASALAKVVIAAAAR
ncbi:MAG: acyltransferase family protein [Burkholderiaceae bacterium]